MKFALRSRRRRYANLGMQACQSGSILFGPNELVFFSSGRLVICKLQITLLLIWCDHEVSEGLIQLNHTKFPIQASSDKRVLPFNPWPKIIRRWRRRAGILPEIRPWAGQRPGLCPPDNPRR